MDSDQFQAALETGIRLLARREHAGLELRLKLRQRDYSDDVIDAVIADLTARGYLSEERFAEIFVRHKVESGWGPARIAAEMRKRGIDDTVFRRYFDSMDVDWLKQAREVRQRRFGSGRPRDRRDWARQGRFLAGRGFSAEQIARVLDDPGEESI
ncbi:MAG: regulatory protein RecX [Aquisalimonadaceae bacterium]